MACSLQSKRKTEQEASSNTLLNGSVVVEDDLVVIVERFVVLIDTLDPAAPDQVHL